MAKKILYVDMDGVLVDFQSGIDQLDEAKQNEYKGREDEVLGIFSLMKPKTGAIDAFIRLSKEYYTYILSTSPWNNPTALQDKQNWVKKYLGKYAEKRLILSHHKNLNKGDYIIDDRDKRGVKKFEGEHIHFGQDKYYDWIAVLDYLLPGWYSDSDLENIMKHLMKKDNISKEEALTKAKAILSHYHDKHQERDAKREEKHREEWEKALDWEFMNLSADQFFDDD